jgi:hypothetical protein
MEKRFIVLELFPEPFVLVWEDGTGRYFETREAALDMAAECQDGMAINVYAKTIIS